MEADRDLEARVGFWPRAGAYLLDVIAVSTIALLLQKPLAGLFPSAVAAMIQEQTSRSGGDAMVPFFEWAARLGVASALITPIYGLLEALRGFSPGKLVMGLRIVTEQGGRPAVSSLLVRFGIKGAGAILTLIAIVSGVTSLHVLARAASWATTVGCLLILGAARTAIHDRVAGTAVMRKADIRVPAGATS